MNGFRCCFSCECREGTGCERVRRCFIDVIVVGHVLRRRSGGVIDAGFGIAVESRVDDVRVESAFWIITAEEMRRSVDKATEGNEEPYED